jgi:hypothetical protein
VENNNPMPTKTYLTETITGEAAPPERVGTVIRTGDNQYKLIDPKTGGTYVLKTQRPWTDEKVIKHINLVVRKNGRVPAGETSTMESPK